MLAFFICIGALVVGFLFGYGYGKDDSQDSYRKEDKDDDYYGGIL